MNWQDYKLDMHDFRQAMRDRSTIPGDEFRHPEFQDVHCAGYLAVDEEAVGSLLDGTSARSFVARFLLRDHVCFAFMKCKHNVRDGGGGTRSLTGCSVMVAAETRGWIDVPRPKGHHDATAAVYVQREYLVEHYGLRVDNLPEQCRDVFHGRRGSHFMFDLILSPRCRMALDAIFGCPMPEPLRSTYWRAKYWELITETIDLLNRYGNGGLGKFMSRDARERHLIETAAQIYRRDLGNAPSVAELSLTLGINRNRLVDGFKEIFGTSPGDFAKSIRLDWAQEQLAAGVMSIGEAAYATGYSNASAFARAYCEHFGRPPSGDVGTSFSDALVVRSPLSPPVLQF